MRLSDPPFPYTNFTSRAFFMPEIESSAAEEVFQDIHSKIVGRPASTSRIQRLKYIRDGRPYIAEVGDAHHRGEKFVMALLGPCIEHGDYYIVTVRRGYLDPRTAMSIRASEVRSLDQFL